MSSVKQDLSEVFSDYFDLEEFALKEVCLEGLFAVQETAHFDPVTQECSLSRKEENSLQLILHEFFNPGMMKEEEVSADFHELRDINLQIKSINNQSILFHGERIKQAQKLLKKYREGAFTAWLNATYGNRQTPYSILQYYEMYHALPNENLKRKMSQIPKKAAYTLASREGDLRLKQRILEDHHDEGQKELIMIIQDTFPLAENDRRKRKEANLVSIESLEKLSRTLCQRRDSLTEAHKEKVREVVEMLNDLL